MNLIKILTYLAGKNGIFDPIPVEIQDGKIINWQLPFNQPTEAELTELEQEMATNWNVVFYKQLRSEAYPSLQEQLDLLYHDRVNGTSSWLDALAAVKAKYPKA